MANYTTLKSAIQQVVKTNGNGEITGALLQQTLFAMVDSLGADYMFVGIAQPSTNPGTPDQNVFYIGGAGTYPNFNSAVVPTGYIGAFKYNGSWTVETVAVGKDYDEQIAQILQIIGSVVNYTLTPSPNLFNKNAATANRYVRKDLGTLGTSADWVASEYIDLSNISDGTTIRIIKTAGYSGVIGVAFYDSNKTFTHGGAGAVAKQSGDKYYRASVPAAEINTAMIVAGNAPGQYYPYGTLVDATLLGNKLAAGSVTGDKLAPGAVADGLIDTINRYMSFNLIDFANIVRGTYINGSGGVSTVSDTQYRATNFIPLDGKKVFYGIGMGSYGSTTNGAAVYDANKNFIRAFRPGASGSYDPVSANENAAYIRLTLVGNYSLYYVLYPDANGNNPLSAAGSSAAVTANINYYREQLWKYSNPDIKFDKSVLPELLPAYSLAGYDGFREQFDSVAAGGNVELDSTKYPTYLKTVHTIVFKAQTMGTLGENDGIRVGVYRNNTSGKAARITATDIRIQRYDAQAGYVNNIVFEHGLTITEFVILELNFNWYGGSLRLVSRDGAFYQEWQYSQYSYTGNAKETSGRAFVESTIALTGVKLGQNSKCFREPIWFIGDSYTTMSLSRWTEQLVENMKIDNQLIAGYAGAGSDAMEPQLELMLQYGTPKYLVWCLGMNDTFAIWINFAKKIEMICRDKGITLIYQTIPKSNSEKDEINLYIRNSGYRYIDFVSAVMRNGEWFPDMDADGTHPTTLGAKVLAGQILVDLPEICNK